MSNALEQISRQLRAFTIGHSVTALCLHCLLCGVVLDCLHINLNAADELQPFLQTYCVACHGESKQKGDRRFDQLRLPVANTDQMIDLQDMVDQLTLGEMPPKSSKQPTVEKRQVMIELLRQSLIAAHANRTSTGSQSVLRRLNRREYLNTLRDLFGIDISMFDPTTNFPRDQTAEHLDNVGDALVTSGYLLQQYLYAADQVVEKVFALKERPAEQTWNFKGRFRQQPEVDRAHQIAFDNRFLCLYECPNSERPEGAFGPLLSFREGVPADGLYEVQIYAEAKHRINSYDPKIIGVDPSEPLRLGIVPGNSRFGPMHVGQPFQPVLAETTLTDDEPRWHTFKIWLDRGFSPRFIFPNGMIDLRSTYAKLVRGYRELLPEESRQATGIVQHRIALFSHGQVPHVRIHEVSIRGPLAESPTLPHEAILDYQPFAREHTQALLTKFVKRAYRRPVADEEVERLMGVVERRSADGLSAEEAFQDALKSALCSPAFLYLQSSDGTNSNVLPPHALASRLSYFLWSSMPDEELVSLAESGEILKPEILQQQSRRLLADWKSDEFVESFLDSWLNLRSLGDMPPDRESFERYYTQDLQAAMRRETVLFTRNLIDENGSILDFLTADYSFVNRQLAKLYGIGDEIAVEDGHRFRRVRFANSNRGGLLGQGSVLTVTANGIETSPVNRGVWLLENILGTPPAPPPDDVPAIDPDVRGSTSIRELLTKHRQSPACYECHQKIDPLGFALENFDPIGNWRTHYDNGTVIDSTGMLPSGEEFHDLAGLKILLAQRQKFFARMLTEKLVAYACGRRVEPLDRPAIHKICAGLFDDGYPLRTLIESIVTSDLFRQQ